MLLTELKQVIKKLDINGIKKKMTPVGYRNHLLDVA